jgi:hypothetical protein
MDGWQATTARLAPRLEGATLTVVPYWLYMAPSWCHHDAMDLAPYIELLRRELAVAAEAGGEEARVLAERLTAPLESAIRLTVLEALSAATAEITRDLAPGSVHLRLNGRDPDFVVTLPHADSPAPPEYTPSVVDEAALAGGDKGGISRINLRLPDDIKARVEEAAGRERISVNAWLVRAAAAALQPASVTGTGHRGSSRGQSFTGWAR